MLPIHLMFDDMDVFEDSNDFYVSYTFDVFEGLTDFDNFHAFLI